MDRRYKLFHLFAQANELSDSADFRAKQRRYSGLGYHSITIEEFMGTIEFVGFIEGYEGRAHRFKMPKGTADTGLQGGNAIDALQSVTVGYFTKSRALEFEKMGIELNARYRGLNTTRLQSSAATVVTPNVQKYDAQYTLGSSLNGVV